MRCTPYNVIGGFLFFQGHYLSRLFMVGTYLKVHTGYRNRSENGREAKNSKINGNEAKNLKAELQTSPFVKFAFKQLSALE